MHASYCLPWLTLQNIMAEPVCNFHFSSENSYFIDYPEAARSCPQSRLKTQPNLGLVDRNCNHSADPSDNSSPNWARFTRHVQRLNDEADPGVTFKVIFVVRHGRGVHNVVRDEVGSAKWKVSSERKPRI